MKKSMIALLGVFVLTISAVTGCSGVADQTAGTETVQNEAAEPAAEASSGQDENGEEAQTGIANPWVEITEEEADGLCTRLFKAPEGANVQEWMKCEDLGDPEKWIGPLIQLDFELDGMYFTARAQQGAAEDADISGIYTEWTTGPDDVTLANWGGGNMAGKMYRSVNETGYIDLITWYDIEIGIKYSLSVAAEDLDGFDIQAVAEQMYSEDNEPYDGSEDALE